jgi:hypothetical protein
MCSWVGFDDVDAFFFDRVRNIQEFGAQAQVSVHASGERFGADCCGRCRVYASERGFCWYVDT